MLTFEPVREEDFEAMADLRAEALHDSLQHLGRFDPVRVRERLRDAFVPACMRHIVRDGRRVGYLTLIAQAPAAELRLHHLYLRPGEQGLGIGAWALDWVKAQARAQQRDVTLCALRESPANRFYVRHGFRVVKELPFDLEYRWSPAATDHVAGEVP